jgi:hypothetical protein
MPDDASRSNLNLGHDSVNLGHDSEDGEDQSAST